MASTFDVAPHPASSPSFQVRMPTPPNGSASLPVTYDTVFTWSFAVERADLRNLYEKSKDSMWNARTDLAWNTNVDPEAPTMPDEASPIFGTRLWDRLDKKTELPKLRRLPGAWMLSHFLHGEQGALLAASQILAGVPSADAKLYAATQVMDEARHVEAYARYLRE